MKYELVERQCLRFQSLMSVEHRFGAQFVGGVVGW